MAIVKIGNRIVYDGPSIEDAEFIYKTCREAGSYKTLSIIPSPSSLVPTGTFGKAILEMEESAKKRVIREAIRNFRSSIPQGVIAQQGAWNGNPSAVPRADVVRNIITSSVSNDYEEAKNEWAYRGEIIYEDDLTFSRECDLCGPRELMRKNYIIRNTRNGNMLCVGSTCIKRFLVLFGTTTTEESADLFDRRTLLSFYGHNQAHLISDLGSSKVPEKSYLSVLETLEKTFPYGLKEEDVEIILREANVGERAREVFRVVALKDYAATRKLNLKIEKMRDRHETWRKKLAARVTTTLSRSGAYKNY